MKHPKEDWIGFFSQKVSEEKTLICSRHTDYKKQTSEINKYINEIREESIQSLLIYRFGRFMIFRNPARSLSPRAKRM